MRSPTDLPRRRTRTPRGRLGLILALVVIFFLIVSLRGIAGFYTDYLWFQELHLTEVWRGVLGAKILLGVIFTIVFFVLMWVNLAIADRIAPAFRPMGPEEELVERYHQVIGARAGLVRLAVAGLFALIAGPSVASRWNSWLLFRNHVPFGIKDPQFHKDIGFYVFQLPFLKFIVDWLFASIIIVLIITAVAHYLNGGIRVQALQKVTPQVKAHLSVLLGVLALLKAAGYYLQQYQLVFSRRGVVEGATYTDVKAQLPALKLLIVISLFAFGLFIYNIYRRGWVLPVIAVGLWAFVSVMAGAAYPAFIQNFRVNPTESAKERPYIDRNIKATRAALKLGGTTVKNFAYNESLNAGDLAKNSVTVRNVRLWDPDQLLAYYQKKQEIRNFYQFTDVDVDRYDVTGQTTQVELSARELNPGGIPSKSWVNNHLVYTHGYGAVASPANAVTPAGAPDLLIKDLPPQGVMQLTQPAVYYGPDLGGYAIVQTDQKEVDFTEASGVNHLSTYKGKGGVQMSSWIRRAALALRFGDINPMISGFVTPHSRAIYLRDIRTRVRKAAPFLKFDYDPYPVILHGHVFWVQDAYTVTSRYPYSQQVSTDRLDDRSGLNGLSFNYVRNSVKVLIDAYNGSMTFYVVDPKDPIVRAYQKAFPKLFTDGSNISAELRAHLRYPEDLFRVQTNMYGLYHITNAAAFYNRTDQWDISQDPGSGRVGTGGATQTTNAQGVLGPARETRMEPYYLLMRLPDEPTEDFLILQPFVPTSKNDARKDLSAFMVAKSDPDDYGRLETFVMPRELQVDGPALVAAKIDNDPKVSPVISLLNQSGSEVLFGNLIVIPIDQSLLYVRPMYVQAAGTPVPQFKKAIVVFGDKVAIEDTLKQALDDIFGAAPPTLEQAPAPSPGAPAPAPSTNATVQQLLQQASDAYAAAQAALAKGDLGTYQAKNNEAADLVRRARDAAGGQPAATTTTAPVASALGPTRMRAGQAF